MREHGADIGHIESDQSYYIPMRDGVRLAISLYFPEGKAPMSAAPAILVQTRFGREWVYNLGEREGGYESFRRSGFVVLGLFYKSWGILPGFLLWLSGLWPHFCCPLTYPMMLRAYG